MVEEFLSRLEKKGVRLWAEDGNLRYEAPEGALTPELRSELVKHKSEVLAFFQESIDAAGPELSPIESIDRNGDLPLSFAQQRLWFLDQLTPGNTQYNIVRAFHLIGELNLAALERSATEITRRHEVLRTTFDKVDGKPVLRISAPEEINFPITDLRSHGKKNAMDEAKRSAEQEYLTPFNLKTRPLFRCKLFRIADDEHVFVAAVHHIASDGWSMGVLYRELGELYKAFSSGQTSPLADLPFQYADFAAWQRQWLKDDVLERQLSYWRKHLANLSPLGLMTDHARPSMQTYRGARESIMLPKEISNALVEFSRRQGATPFMTLLAAFSILLHKYSGQNDIAAGSPIANRNRADIEGLIGFFVNTLVMRINVSGALLFRELLSQVKSTALEAYQHQDAPFENLVEELAPERDMSRNPLFQVLFAFQNAPAPLLEMGNLTSSLLKTDALTTRFDLETHLWIEEKGLNIWLIYNTDLFESKTIRRMLGHFANLLNEIAENPERTVSELRIMDGQETRSIIKDLNPTYVNYPNTKPVNRMFEDQAKLAPGAIAVVHGDESLTYEELNKRANRLANYLKSKGVGPGESVGICLNRSLAMTVGVLAVLKTGGAYLPLDPAYPKDRLALMLDDAQAPALLTQKSFLDNLPESNAEIICLDVDESTWETMPEGNPESDVSLKNTAYLIFTSGSTGRPKGVDMHHGALCNLINWQLENTPVAVDSRTLQFTSLSFDVSFQEIFSTWCGGGTLVLIDEPARRDPRQLLSFLDDNKIERLFLPFVALQQLAETAAAKNQFPLYLKTVITAGEQLRTTPALVKFFKNLRDCRLYNQYGPSETHVVSSFLLEGDPDAWPMLPPIGRPIANVRIYISDKDENIVPVGVPGELLIGGECVSKGYLKQPALTGERFVKDPFSANPSDRLYKTGDLARWLPDGNIEFLGRIDQQVKIRGFRVELGEIETILAEHPNVLDAATAVKVNDSGIQRLLAYIVLHPGHSTDSGNIKIFLGQKLPDYMIPSKIIFVDALPLAPSGKVDKKALISMDVVEEEALGAHIEPGTPTEKTIAEIWSNILETKRIGVNDNFFDLGGHSLLAAQAAARLGNAFSLELPLLAIFERPTVAGLAGYIETVANAIDDAPKNATATENREQWEI